MALGSIGSAVSGLGSRTAQRENQAPGSSFGSAVSPTTAPQTNADASIWRTRQEEQRVNPALSQAWSGGGGVGAAAGQYGSALNNTQSTIDLQKLLAGPQFAGLNLSSAQGRRDYGFASQGYNLARGDLRGDYNSDVARLGLSQQGLGLDRQDLDTQRARLGIDRQGNVVDRGYIGAMRGLADRSLATTLSGIDRGQRNDIRDIASDYTSRGSWFAPFQREDRQEVIADAEQARTEARYQREGQEHGWNRDLAKLGLSDQNIDLSYRDLATAESRLDLQAQQLGLDRADLDRALQSGLAQLGLDQAQSYQGLLDLLASNDIAGWQLMNDILIAAWQTDPSLLPMFGAGIGNGSVAAP